MRLLLSILAIAIFAPLVTWFAPWWLAAVIAGIIGYTSRLRTGAAFLAGFLGLGLAWLSIALFRDLANESLLSGRMAQVFGLPAGFLFIVLTFVLGAIVGGLAAWSGAQLRRLFQPAKTVPHAHQSPKSSAIPH